MSITHRHRNIGMTKHISEYQNIAAIHHKVTGERVTKNVRGLARWKGDPNLSFEDVTNRRVALLK